jgi:hypothetical protein
VYNFYDIVFKVDNYLKIPSNESLNQIIELYNHKGIEKYFWNTLCINESLEHLNWFKILNENNMFNIDNSKEIENINERKFIAYWKPLDYLEKISLILKDSNNQEKLQKLINKLIDNYYKLSKKEYILHGHIYWITFKILSNLEAKYLSSFHINFLRFVLSNNDKTLISGDLSGKFFDKIFETNDRKIIKSFFDLILSFEFEKSSSREFKSLVESYWLRELARDKLELIPLKYKIDILEIALMKIENILEHDKYAFNITWFPSIEKNSKKRYGASDILKVCIDFTRDLLEEIEPNNIHEKVNSLIESKNVIFKRLAIHTIKHHYSDLKTIFWGINYNPIDKSELHHEIFKLFENHKNEFTSEEAKKIIEWNESQNFEYLKEFDNYDTDKEKWINIDKRKILYALKDSTKHQIFKEEFEKYDSMLDSPDEHPEFYAYSESFSWIGDKSPFTTKEILEMNLENLIKEINEFKESEKFGNKSNRRGFGKEIEQTITDNYENFINSLTLFLNIPIDYQQYILRALNSNIKNFSNKELNLYIDYFEKLINEFKFNGEHNPLVYEFSEFISKISSSESNILIEKKEVKIIINMFDNLKEKIKYYNFQELNKSDILNSNEGQFYTSIIIFSLKIARDKLNHDEELRWNFELKEIIENDLNNKKSFQLFEVIGKYLPNLFYLDENWIKSKLSFLFMNDMDIYVESALIGYFSNHTVYLKIFEELHNLGVIEKALNYTFDEQTSKKVVEFICFAFISDRNHELINKIIDDGNYKQKQKLIQFFQNRGNEKDINVEKHIVPLWHKLLASLNKKEFKPLYIELLQWMNTLKTIDKETYDLIINTINEIETIPMYSTDVIRNLYKLAEVNLKETAKILILLLRKFDIYIYQNEKMISIVESVYKSGLNIKANEIVNILGEKGNYSFKELYIEYNS